MFILLGICIKYFLRNDLNVFYKINFYYELLACVSIIVIYKKMLSGSYFYYIHLF